MQTRTSARSIQLKARRRVRGRWRSGIPVNDGAGTMRSGSDHCGTIDAQSWVLNQ